MSDQSQSDVGHKRGRRVTACIECRKRKKKCDRRWPCNHCRRRQSAHECKYETKVASGPSDPAADQSTRSSTQGPVSAGDSAEASAAVISLGYMDDPVLKMIATTAQSSDTAKSSELSGPVLQASRAVPPRPYADMLMQSFFDNVNHHYCILYQPSFQTSYETWWSRRLDVSYLCALTTIAFTTLILRVCSSAIQFLPKDGKDRLESELGDSAADLSQLYHEAANSLSDLLPPGVAGLVNAQQLFLGATWLKAEANFVESWHMLAGSVRQAQEIGIDTDKSTPDMTGYELDSRRRLWCSLDTWDRFMTAVFNRPRIIGSSNPVPYPSTTLRLSGVNSDAPSAALAKVLENQLGRVLSGTEPGNRSLEESLATVESWMSALPPVFSLCVPETRWDEDAPFLRFQRLQLHCVGYMTQLALMKAALAVEPQQQNHIEKATEVSLLAMRVCQEFFDLCFPHQAKYFMVSFCPFDVAAFLCSLLLRDGDRALWRRAELLNAVGSALSMSFQLRDYTKMGEPTWTILNALVSRLQLGPDENDALGNLVRVHNLDDGELKSMPGGQVLPSENVAAPMGQWQDENVLFGGSTEGSLDLGVLDGVWDWQSLSNEFNL
ncbi:Zn(2)-C6 fungal-type domain-containing protein [Fusarium sp. LHS14.1]|nr:Zn(2)-C6 fungal-type domain-containing protein [Fusarium sp. LHS14.1]